MLLRNCFTVSVSTFHPKNIMKIAAAQVDLQSLNADELHLSCYATTLTRRENSEKLLISVLAGKIQKIHI